MEYQQTNRVIVLVDMDCFYCQVEEKLDPSLVGKPIAVVQYNAWQGGGIIAVNYPARDKGVTRHMRGDEAKKKCPEIRLVSVPTTREKADLTRYRDAGKDVAAVLQTFTNLLERASVDEAYLDITDSVNKRLAAKHPIKIDQLKNTHVVGCDIKDFIHSFEYEHHLENNLKLCMGGIIVEEIRAAVLEKTGYKCSAGIAHNKILAKLACGLHKPNQQTIVTQDAVDDLFETLPPKKIRGLGGNFGNDLCEDLGIKTMGELKKFTERDLINKYDEKTGSWLYKLARGVDQEPVTPRLVSKSIGCCKKFPGKSALIEPADVLHWINDLSDEISERLTKDLEENNRKAKNMVVGFVQRINRKDVSATRTHPLLSYEKDKIAADVLKVVNKYCLNVDGFYHIKYLGISAGKFEDCKKTYDISNFFKTCDKVTNTDNVNDKYNAPHWSIAETNRPRLSNVNSISFNAESTNFNVNIAEDENDNNYKSCNEEENLNSIFSDDTVMLDIDRTKLIYNENYCCNLEGFFTNTTTVTKNKDSETDSVNDEIIKICEKGSTPQEPTSSYFSNYFNDMESRNRNFDTSKILDFNLDTDTSSATEHYESGSASTSECNELMKDAFESTSTASSITSECINIDLVPNHNSIENANNTEINTLPNSNNPELCRAEKCKECNKTFLSTEIAAHMDYHYALQIVRNEAHLYNNQKESSIANLPKKSTEIKATKRKKPEVTSIKLTKYFENRTQPPSDTPTEICPECNRNISTDDFLNHLDYHVAKKLHSELNPMEPPKTKDPVNSKTVKKIKQTTKGTKPKSVISFFKQHL